MITKLKILTAKFLEDSVSAMALALNQVSATGKTDRSIHSELKDSEDGIKAKIFARGYTSLIEKGRGPTSKRPSREMIENLIEYAKARGMEDPERAAWAIATEINKHGDKTFQKGGREVYSDDLDKLLEKYIADTTKAHTDFVVDEIKGAFNKK